ncbi:MAG: 16S rRNA (guanine(527)-N(7))-methyltransferase RsmG [Coriobacteriales bacterium]|jgi:16S rRNA (guanine527-N7)-methyltransferase|nr:16S rRNA (guanine(527)-N(7))-methyltransferase RsmG [Coriobacteriales bacterium]
MLARLSSETQTLLKKHLQHILEANKKINLTRITLWDKALLLHVEDSLAGLGELAQAPKGRFADLGSGGGFPGIPLALAGEREAVLIESVQKKARILEESVSLLGVGEQIVVAAMRSEELAQKQGARFAAVTARAVTALPILMELAQPLLVFGGRLIAYKSITDGIEIEKARSIETLLGMRIIAIRELLLSDGKTQRAIISVEKTGESQIFLPRRPGIAQKHPLV